MYAGTILGIAVLFVFGRWQMLKGKGEATEPGPMVGGHILGAVIDEHKANELISSIDRLTLAVVDHTTATRPSVEMLMP